jgi:RNA polymerase sigma-70 factor (ECF subfamily)
MNHSVESPNPPSGGLADDFMRLLGRHERELMAFVLALVPNWADADDVLQEVRSRLWAQFETYDATRDFGTWARAIAYWQVQTWRKSAQRRTVIFNTEVLDAIAHNIEEHADNPNARGDALRHCLDKLDLQSRQVIDLYYTSKKTAKELANDLGRSFHAIRHTIQRTRIALADCIEKTLRERGEQ